MISNVQIAALRHLASRNESGTGTRDNGASQHTWSRLICLGLVSINYGAPGAIIITDKGRAAIADR